MFALFSRVKLVAAARSMHQFCNAVRSILPGDVKDDVVEAATGFLYLSVSADVFGNQATARIRRIIRKQLKYLDPAEFMRRIERIRLQAEAFRVSEMSASGKLDDATAYQVAVNGAIRSLCIEAGVDHTDEEMLRECFPRFEQAAARIKTHLAGIRRQNRWLIG